MTLPKGMYAAIPGKPDTAGRGKPAKLLSDEKVKVLLATPDTWYVIGKSDIWISGSARNIMQFIQKNIKHLEGLGRFIVCQRRNKTDNCIDIYAKWMPNDYLEEE
tara:strand:- start:16290 stop:16604 length:315 start_codon:yes stop_codon:yes gene_type:complete